MTKETYQTEKKTNKKNFENYTVSMRVEEWWLNNQDYKNHTISMGVHENDE